MSEQITLPVIGLRDGLLFPQVAMPVPVGRAPSLAAIEAATAGDRRVLVVAQRKADAELTGENLHDVGVMAHIDSVRRTQRGVHALLRGMERVRVVRYQMQEGRITAECMPLADVPPLEPEGALFSALFKEIQVRALELARNRRAPAAIIEHLEHYEGSAESFGHMVATHLDVTLDERQALLEETDVEARLRATLVHVQRKLDEQAAQEDIQSQVKAQLGNHQREVYLRQQLEAIRKELGDGEGGDALDDLRKQLADIAFPQEVQKVVDRELGRLGRMGAEGAEAQVLRNYLQQLAELPWNARSIDRLELEPAAAILDADHHGLQEVKDRVLEFLAVRRLRADREAQAQAQAQATATASAANADSPVDTHPEADTGTKADTDLDQGDNRGERSRAMARGPILLFTGPPGVGKTSIGKSIAKALGREYVRIALGGVRDEADIRGHRRTYVGAMPGRIIDGLKRAKTRNPVFLLDEIDKLGVSHQGNPASALLEVLDPAQNDSFTDHYLGVPFDLSEVLFIATANQVEHIPGPLLDRMEVVEFSGYTEKEKLAIAERYLVPRQLRESGLTEAEAQFAPEALQRIISRYTREAGVRRLERRIGAVTRKLARRIASEQPVPKPIDADAVRELLGRPPVSNERAFEQDTVGVATGMYYTPMGGDIMFIESSIRALRGSRPADTAGTADSPGGDGALGQISLILTGQLGDVMRESARAALTFASTHAESMAGVALDGPLEAHIHVPAGAIPKDGPSAGIAMATTLVSALSGRPVRGDTAMTGEATLRGRVLPIGGVKEKVLGAHRAGIKHIILPADNAPDLEDLPDDVRESMRFTPVHTLDEVFAHALLPPATPGDLDTAIHPTTGKTGEADPSVTTH